MQHILLRTALALGLLSLCGGCSEEVKPEPPTYSQLLTGKESKTWRLSSFQVFDDGTGSGTVNAREFDAPCIVDDLYVFYANDVKTMEVEEGASKCNPADPDLVLEDTWSLVNASATLEFNFAGFIPQKLNYKVRNLTENTLTVEFYYQDYVPDVNLTYRFTFTAQNDR
ncbi:MAG TPA: hypothetical protein VF646_07715 [Cytophagales bacterium]|jgi:hypothetical protein